MTRERMARDYHEPHAFAQIINYCQWPMIRGEMAHCLFFVDYNDWGLTVEALQGRPMQLDWAAHRISFVTRGGIVHVQADADVEPGQIEFIKRGGLTHDDCIVEAERWMALAVQVRDHTATPSPGFDPG